MTAPFDDLLVVSLEQAVAAPYCSRLFAEAGARVIKLERPEGDFARAYDTVINGQSAYFVWLNSGKESVTVDLRQEADKALLRNLLQRADVFIQNLKPGALGRLGFAYDAVRALNESLVMCSISGYGTTGPYAQMKAYDALIQAESGLCSVTGRAGDPAKVGASIVDLSTGLTAYAETLRALLERAHGASGCHVEVSMFNVMSEWMAVPLAYYEHAGKLLTGTGMDHGQIAPYGAYATNDGLIFIVIQNQREWRQLCEQALQRPQLADDPRYVDNAARMEHRDGLRAEIETALGGWSRSEAAERLLAADIACGNINDLSDLGDHPALVTKTIVVGDKPVSVIGRLRDGLTQAAVPALDQHGADIRREFS